MMVDTFFVSTIIISLHIELTFFKDGEAALFDFDKYPIVVVSGRSNIISTTKRLQINAGLKITTTGKYERCWDLNPRVDLAMKLPRCTKSSPSL